MPPVRKMRSGHYAGIGYPYLPHSQKHDQQAGLPGSGPAQTIERVVEKTRHDEGHSDQDTVNT